MNDHYIYVNEFDYFLSLCKPVIMIFIPLSNLVSQNLLCEHQKATCPDALSPVATSYIQNKVQGEWPSC